MKNGSVFLDMLEHYAFSQLEESEIKIVSKMEHCLFTAVFLLRYLRR
jgi:hypothetical protein